MKSKGIFLFKSLSSYSYTIKDNNPTSISEIMKVYQKMPVTPQMLVNINTIGMKRINQLDIATKNDLTAYPTA